MFGKLSPEQRKRLQALLIESGLIATYQKRVHFLEDAGLGKLMHSLPMEEEGEIFAGSLVRAAERLGKPPEMREFATVLLLLPLRHALRGDEDTVAALTVMIAVYVPNHATKYPFEQPSDPDKNPELRILFLAANPSQTGKLSLREEFEHIQQALDAKKQTDPALDVKLILRENVQDETIINEIASVKPHILHFAGHGDLIRASNTPMEASNRGYWRGFYLLDEAGHEVEHLTDDAKPSGIVLETAQNRAKLLPDRVLVNIFKQPKIHEHIRLVLLNACWAQGQAERLIRDAAIPFAIGMKQPINDGAAVRFAQGFYQSLFLRDSMQSAFDLGCNQMLAVVGEGHDDIPTLHVRPGIIAANYFIFDML